VNSVSLIGNLATEVDLKDVGEDRQVGNFLLAIDRPGQDAGADFVRITVWNKQAETCARYLGKGRRVGVDGRLRSRSWEDADGTRRSAVDVVAHRVQFLDPQTNSETEEAPFEAATAS
jgi:single-strand DNA-binding protein